MIETITFFGVLIGIIASIAAISAYKMEHVSKPNEELQFLMIKFMSTRRLSLSVTEQLEKYAKYNNAYQQHILPDTTIATYIKLLKQSQSTNLSEKLLEDTMKLPLTSPLIQSMVNSLENQFNDLLKIEGWIKSKMIQ